MIKRSGRGILVDVVEGEEKGFFFNLLRFGLTILSGVYGFLIGLLLFLYRCRLLKRKRLPAYTISVGNITVGGTGKTPAVEMLAEELQKGKRKVAILSRGYKRAPGRQSPPKCRRAGMVSSKMPAGRHGKMGVVCEGRNILMEVREAGDEPYLLARSLSGVVVMVGKDRISSGNYALTNFGVDTIILDDGYQYWPLRRNLDIVVVDSVNPFGNGHLLPRGRLREPLKNLGRGDLFLLTRVDQADDLEGLREKLKKLNPGAKIMETVHRPDRLLELRTREERQLPILAGKRVLALSSIGHPESFKRTLTSLGALLVEKVRFPDHHWYKEDELRGVGEVALRKEAEFIVTTEKDAVRIPPGPVSPVEILYLKIKLRIVKGEEILEELLPGESKGSRENLKKNI